MGNSKNSSHTNPRNIITLLSPSLSLPLSLPLSIFSSLVSILNLTLLLSPSYSLLLLSTSVSPRLCGLSLSLPSSLSVASFYLSHTMPSSIFFSLYLFLEFNSNTLFIPSGNYDIKCLKENCVQ